MTLLRGFLSVSGLVFASRALGLARDVVIAAVFGAGAATDAFFAAFRLPNTLRRFTAEGALTQAFVPVYRQEYERRRARAGLLAAEVILLLALLLLAASALCILFAPQVIFALAPGLANQPLAALLLRIVFPYVVLISLVALFSGMLNARAHFTAAAAAPLFLNLAMIAAALWGAPLVSQPLTALAAGVLAGGLLQFGWTLWHLSRAGLLPPWAFFRRFLRGGAWRFFCLARPSAAARRVLSLFWRSALGAGVAQINLLINLFIASFLAAGSLSWLYYADRLMELPAGLLGAALTTVALPALSANAGNAAAFSMLLDNTLRLLLLLALPAAAGMAFLSLPLVATLFMHGAFDQTDALMTQQAVLAYAAGVVGLVAVRPLAAAFFARQSAAVPVRAALAALAATQGLNALFILGLQMAHAGLALSVGIGACVNALILYAVLIKRGWYCPGRRGGVSDGKKSGGGWLIFFAQVGFALAAMLAFLIWVTPEAHFWLSSPFSARALKLLLCIGGAAAVYFIAARLAGLSPRQFNQAV